MFFKQIDCRVLRRATGCAAVALMLVACEATVDQRGNLPEADQMGQIEVGKTDKANVTRILGSPSSVAAFDPNVWYYVSVKTKAVAFFKPQTLEQQVLAITFDGDVVKSVDRKELKDAETITPNPNETPSAGREFSVIEMFLGNFGKFSKKGAVPGN